MAPPSHTGISLSTKELAAMAEAKLHLVFGGRVSDPQTLDFKELDKLDVVGIFPNYNEAEEAWRAAAQRTVDDAEMRYVVVHLHKLLDPDHPGS
jgi:hypothetical protein